MTGTIVHHLHHPDSLGQRGIKIFKWIQIYDRPVVWIYLHNLRTQKSRNRTRELFCANYVLFAELLGLLIATVILLMLMKGVNTVQFKRATTVSPIGHHTCLPVTKRPKRFSHQHHNIRWLMIVFQINYIKYPTLEMYFLSF